MNTSSGFSSCSVSLFPLLARPCYYHPKSTLARSSRQAQHEPRVRLVFDLSVRQRVRYGAICIVLFLPEPSQRDRELSDSRTTPDRCRLGSFRTQNSFFSYFSGTRQPSVVFLTRQQQCTRTHVRVRLRGNRILLVGLLLLPTAAAVRPGAFRVDEVAREQRAN